jgi:hypothetical protein
VGFTDASNYAKVKCNLHCESTEGGIGMLTRTLIFLSMLFSLCATPSPVIAQDDDEDNPGAGAQVGDSCKSNRDCDRSAGQHCIKNACAIPRKSGGGGSADDSGRGNGGSLASNCGLPAGVTLKCKLYSGQVFDACGHAGAIPARVGDPCHIGYAQGIAVQ